MPPTLAKSHRPRGRLYLIETRKAIHATRSLQHVPISSTIILFLDHCNLISTDLANFVSYSHRSICRAGRPSMRLQVHTSRSAVTMLRIHFPIYMYLRNVPLRFLQTLPNLCAHARYSAAPGSRIQIYEDFLSLLICIDII